MKKILATFLFLGISSVSFFLLPEEASAANPAARTNTAKAPITIANYYSQQMGFYESLPKGYNDDPNRRWPLIVFLHGDGEKGNGTTELPRVLGAGLPRVINEGAQLEYTVNGRLDSFLVIAPQLLSGSSEWHPYQVDAFIEYAKANYRIDTNRIYVTGLSLGAFGATRYPEFSAAFAQKIAAVVATDGANSGTSIFTPDYLGGAAPLNACLIPQNNVKTWFIWGDADGWVWTINGALAQLAACLPSAAPTKTTIYPGLGHGVWERTYDPGNTYQTPNTYEWLLAQSRGTVTVTPPTPGNQSPTAVAGSDQTITLPANVVTLSGSGTDADGTVASYVWSKLSGGAATIVNSTNATTQITGLVQGDYTFRLTVTDNDGATAADDVQVTVHAAAAMTPGTERIVITPEMLFNETVTGNEAKLFDEQQTLVVNANGEPSQAARPVVCKGIWEEPPASRTCFHANDTNSNAELAYPGKVIIDFGSKYRITDIYIYDDRGAPHAIGDNEPFQAWTGGPMVYTQKIATHNFEEDNKWVRVPVTPTETRYLKMQFSSGHGFIGEMVIYGVPTEPKARPASVPDIQPKYTFDKMVGTNVSFGMGQDASGTKYDDKWGTVRIFGALRWTFDKNDNLNPVEGISLETVTRLVSKGVNVYNVIMGAAWTMVNPTDPFYISEEYTAFSDRKAIDYTLCIGSKIVGGQPSCDTIAKDPASYAHKAWLSKQVAKRDYDLGMRMIELGNEPDGFWQNAGYYAPFEIAAMMSADYDGHCNTLRYKGETVGVKNGAPGMKVLSPAVSQPDTRYMKAMQFWFMHNRPCAPTFAADIVNFHTYATTLGYQHAGLVGVSMPPEEFGIRRLSEEFIDFRNRYAPHAEIAMTEFGVDTYYEKHINPTHQWCGSTIYGNSWAYAPKVGPYDEKEVQGQWLVRSYLEQAAAGLDFVNQFWLTDQYREEESCFTFTTAGLLKIKEVNNWRPTYEAKPSWYYTQTVRHRLAGMQYDNDKKVNGISVMKFKSVTNPSAVAYVLWSPTGIGYVNPAFNLSFDAAAQASVVELTVGSEQGTVISSSNGPVRSMVVPVSERPIIVLANESGGPILPVDLAVEAQAIQANSGSVAHVSLIAAFNDATLVQSVLWKQIGGPKTLVIQNPEQVQTQALEAPAGTYVFEVSVTPKVGAVITKNISITVIAPVSTSSGGGSGGGGRSGGSSPSAPIKQGSGAPTQPSPSAPGTQERIRINVRTALKVRSAPNGAIIGNTLGGTVATVLQRLGDWVKVRFDTGSEGWVAAPYTVTISQPAFPQSAPIPGTTSTSGARVSINVATTLKVRATPGGVLTARANGGTTATVLERGVFVAGVEWVKVKFATGLEGWVVGNYLKPIAATGGTSTAPALTSGSVRTTAVILNVRTAPGGPIFNTVSLGTTGTIVPGTVTGNWAKVRFSNGIEGYVSRSFLRDN